MYNCFYEIACKLHNLFKKFVWSRFQLHYVTKFQLFVLWFVQNIQKNEIYYNKI